MSLAFDRGDRKSSNSNNLIIFQIEYFWQVTYYNFTDGLREASRLNRPLHLILLWGSLEDQSCWGSARTLRETALESPRVLQLLSDNFVSSWSLVVDLKVVLEYNNISYKGLKMAFFQMGYKKHATTAELCMRNYQGSIWGETRGVSTGFFTKAEGVNWNLGVEETRKEVPPTNRALVITTVSVRVIFSNFNNFNKFLSFFGQVVQIKIFFRWSTLLNLF